MRVRNLVVVALLALPALPAASSAQGIRVPLPRTPRGTVPQPTPLPPEAPAVTRALAYKRSRWSAEGYTLISAFQIPSASGGMTKYTAPGAGTHADYRYTDHFSATMDLTATLPGSPTIAQTVEAGTRYSPLSWNHQLRPFFDLRGSYMHMYDVFAASADPSIAVGGVGSQFVEGGRYSHGLGGVAGAGMEFSMSRSFALTTEFSAMRNRMTTSRLVNPATIPPTSNYWMTSFRYIIGLKFNPVSALHMDQNPSR